MTRILIKDGESEVALVGPWAMGRDKKSPKPVDAPAFHTLVKTASEVLRRHEQQLHVQHHRSLNVTVLEQRVTVHLDVVPDEDHPYATLSACDALGGSLAQVRVPPDFRLTAVSAAAWAHGGFGTPT